MEFDRRKYLKCKLTEERQINMKIIINTVENLKNAIEALRSLDVSKGYVFTLSKRKVPRSVPQNRLLWLWLECLERDSETGYTKEEFYLYFLQEFPVYKEVFQKHITLSSSQFTAEQMSKWMDAIKEWCFAELSITLPDPDDLRWGEFYQRYT